MAKDAEIKVKITADAGAASSELGKLDNAADKASKGGLKGLADKIPGLSGMLSSDLPGGAGAASGGIGMLGGVAATGGAAIAAFAVKGVAAFQELGIETGQFRDATGLSAEESSRWIEVAGDHGIAASDLSGAIGKMEKTLGANSEAFSKYGIETVKAKDGTVDANATFLNAVDALNKIKDPTEKAAAGAAIFGKSWTGMAELIGDGAPKLREDLASVQPEKIFTDGDIDSSKNLRDAFDQIKDAGEGLLLTVGKSLAPVISGIAPIFAKILASVGPLAEAIGSTLGQALESVTPLLEGLASVLGPLFKGMGLLVGVVGDVFEGLTTFSGGLTGTNKVMIEADTITQKYGLTQQALQASVKQTGIDHDTLSKIQSDYAGNVRMQIVAVLNWKESQDLAASSMASFGKESEQSRRANEMNTTSVELSEAAIKANAEALRVDMAAAAQGAQAAIDGLTASFDALKGSINDDQAFLNLQDEFDAVKEKGAAAFEAASTGAADAEQKTRDHAQSVNALKLDIIDYAQNIAKLPATQVTNLLAEVDSGQLDLVEAQIERMKANSTINLQIIAKGGAGYGALTGARAAGGPVEGGASYLIGEQGPEVVTFGSNGMVTPNDRLGGSTVHNYFLKLPNGYSDPSSFIKTRTQAYKRGDRG